MKDRLRVAIPETVKVALWVAVSAGITALASWVLDQPDLVGYYGLANIVLYLIKELKKE
jgi:hypothetical protein